MLRLTTCIDGVRILTVIIVIIYECVYTIPQNQIKLDKSKVIRAYLHQFATSIIFNSSITAKKFLYSHLGNPQLAIRTSRSL